MRFSVLILAAVMIFSAGLGFAIDAANCLDGTPYNGCSTKTPGYWCHGSLTSPTLDVLLTVCPCTKTPGWAQQGEGDNAICVQAKCSDGTSNGQCSITKPKMCVNGALADNATACGCPSGKKASANGLTCEFIPCTDGTVSVPEGLCSPKTSGKKCVNGQLVDKASDCPCKSGTTKQGEACVVLCEDSTKSGECSTAKPKECVMSETGIGVLIDNAAKCGCPSGQVADGKRCTTTISVLGGGADLLGGTSGNSSQSGSSSASPLACCCLPAALIMLVAGFATFGKNE